MQSVYEQENINAGRTLQHKPVSTMEGQRVALMNVVSFNEIRDTMRFDDVLCECRHYGRNREDLHHQA